MIYTQKIHTDLQINTLEDLAKLKPFLEDGTLKVNKSQIVRELGKDRRIVKNAVHRVFRKISSIFWSKRSSFERKYRKGQLPRSFISWKQKVLSHPMF